jgi:hypothetical protein
MRNRPGVLFFLHDCPGLRTFLAGYVGKPNAIFHSESEAVRSAAKIKKFKEFLRNVEKSSNKLF